MPKYREYTETLQIPQSEIDEINEWLAGGEKEITKDATDSEVVRKWVVKFSGTDVEADVNVWDFTDTGRWAEVLFRENGNDIGGYGITRLDDGLRLPWQNEIETDDDFVVVIQAT